MKILSSATKSILTSESKKELNEHLNEFLELYYLQWNKKKRNKKILSFFKKLKDNKIFTPIYNEHNHPLSTIFSINSTIDFREYTELFNYIDKVALYISDYIYWINESIYEVNIEMISEYISLGLRSLEKNDPKFIKKYLESIYSYDIYYNFIIKCTLSLNEL